MKVCPECRGDRFVDIDTQGITYCVGCADWRAPVEPPPKRWTMRRKYVLTGRIIPANIHLNQIDKVRKNEAGI